jgi:arylsulfatase A-like enzyme/HEAT repeat protein
MLIVFAPVATARLLDTPQGGMAIERSAPVSGKLLALASGLLPPIDENLDTVIKHPKKNRTRVAQVQKGVDLRNRDVLLVTVDALRADRLSAYGGSGLTPNMDALSREAVVFLRAYTPTPHTSYALASLLTGKFLKPVMELFPEDRKHPTLASLLRRYGYRTAAFYPPAVFYIDEERFNPFRNKRFGFEYQKETFAAAPELVQQVVTFLAKADAAHPLFVWVHFFEPHEPYEPNPEFTRGRSPEERYDGEVAAADDAVGKLVTAFRAKKPNAIVILTADHGEEFGEHGGYYHGTTLYDEQVRVPFIWSTPSAIEPRLVQHPVELVDIAVTLLSVLGIPRHAGMHGDDLSSLLLGSDPISDGYAFSEINNHKMVCDGRYKAICTVGQNQCRLFDLLSDPSESRSLHEQRPAVISTLRGALAQFIASIPKKRAASAQNDQQWSEIFSRAKLGDPMVGSDLVPLLGSQSAQVRHTAARFCGELNYLPAAPIVSRLSVEDSDESVRAESAIAAVCFGQESARAQVEQLLTSAKVPSDGDHIDRNRRAALCLAKSGSRAVSRVLVNLAEDRSASRSMRKRAIKALGAIGEKRAVRTLIDLLADDFLRIEVINALGDIGGKEAADALVRAFKKERYLVARQAEAHALIRMKDRRAKALIYRFLGTDGSLPGGVDMLLSMGALAWVSGQGADLRRSEKARLGLWDCSQVGCRPGEDAAILLPAKRAPDGPARAVFRLIAQSDSDTLSVGDRTMPLRAGEQEVGFSLSAKSGSRRISVSSTSGVQLVAVVVVSDRAGKEGPS